MNRHALYHEPKSRFAYAYNKETLHIRFRSARGDLGNVTVIALDPYSYIPNEMGEWHFDLSKRFYIDMVQEHSDDMYDYWFCAVDHIESLRIRYAFILDDEVSRLFYGPYLICSMEDYDTIAENGMHYFNFPFINEEDIYQAPGWVKDAVWYQIYPERFHRSDRGPALKGLMTWGQEKVVNNAMVFGGNLYGILEKLDYLQDLGISGIYFTPMFQSPSTHKYDTSDYFKIDKAFGDNNTLKLLVTEAHKRNIKVMLDGVFNHCGYYHPFWQDVLVKGSESKYYECFYIDGSEVHLKDHDTVFALPTGDVVEKLNYRVFGTAPNMPKWNTSNPIVRTHLIDVGKYWIEEYDIDGWRLDVSNEVSHDFWRAFRKEIKAVKPEAYIIGENWDNSYPWLAGDQFDGVMNYELLNIIWNFIGVQNNREKYDVQKFVYELGKYMVNYPRNIIPFMFNMVDSHDTARVMTVAGQDVNKAKLIYLLQFIMPGSPSVMYGSEIGLEGNFESARGCMIFDEQTRNHELYKFLKKLITLRKKYEIFKSLDYTVSWVDRERNSMLLKKTLGKDELLIVINNSGRKEKYLLDGHEGLVEVEAFGYHLVLNGQRLL